MNHKSRSTLDMINEARGRVCRRLGDAKLTRMWNKLGPSGYFLKLRRLTGLELRKMSKGTSS